MIEAIKNTDPETYKALKEELVRQKTTIDLIASENYVNLQALGSVAINKYSER